MMPPYYQIKTSKPNKDFDQHRQDRRVIFRAYKFINICQSMRLFVSACLQFFYNNFEQKSSINFKNSNQNYRLISIKETENKKAFNFNFIRLQQKKWSKQKDEPQQSLKLNNRNQFLLFEAVRSSFEQKEAFRPVYLSKLVTLNLSSMVLQPTLNESSNNQNPISQSSLAKSTMQDQPQIAQYFMAFVQMIGISILFFFEDSSEQKSLSSRHKDQQNVIVVREANKIQQKVWIESEQSIKQEQFEQGLNSKLERLKQFISSLRQVKYTSINPDSLDQLQIQEQVYRNVGFEVVIHQTEKRIQKMTKTRKLKRNWSICDLKILIWLICKHCEKDGIPIWDVHSHDESWKLISSLIPGTSAQSCLFKWLSLKRHKITLHGWSEIQEEILVELEKKYADSRNKWKFISQELYSINPLPDKIYRHPKQCREHYASFLDPTIKKGPWTKQEDLMLLSHIIENNGEKKWCKLVRILEGRTENAIKNRFQLVFAKLKRKKQNKSKAQLDLITQYVLDNGGDIIKKQRDQAVNNQSPPPSIKSISPQRENPTVEPAVKIPVIPTFNFFSSTRSFSAFVPYLQQPIYHQVTETVFQTFPGKSIVSLENIPFQRQQ